MGCEKGAYRRTNRAHSCRELSREDGLVVDCHLYFPTYAVLLVNDQGGQRGVLKQEGMPLSGRDESLLGIAVLDREPCGRLQLFHPEPAVAQAVGRAGQLNAPVLVRGEYAQVVVFAGS